MTPVLLLVGAQQMLFCQESNMRATGVSTPTPKKKFK